MDADPRLLSQLEKIQNPSSKLAIQIEVRGAFSFPAQWLEVDEGNREVFSQKIAFEGIELSGAKTVERVPTEEELAQLDDKGKKKKDAPKKVGNFGAYVTFLGRRGGRADARGAGGEGQGRCGEGRKGGQGDRVVASRRHPAMRAVSGVPVPAAVSRRHGEFYKEDPVRTTLGFAPSPIQNACTFLPYKTHGEPPLSIG